MSRLEPLEGPTDFEAQFTCEAGATTDYFGLRGSDLQVGRDLFTIVPLKSDHDVSHILSLKESSGYQGDNERFLRAFAASVVDMLCSGKTLYDQVTFVLLSPDQAVRIGIASRDGDRPPPPPYEAFVTLDSRFSKSDYVSSDIPA